MKRLLVLILLMSPALFAQTYVSCPAIALTASPGHIEAVQSTCVFQAAAGNYTYTSHSALTNTFTLNTIDGYMVTDSGIQVAHAYIKFTTPTGNVAQYTLYNDKDPGGTNTSALVWPQQAITLPPNTTVEYEMAFQVVGTTCSQITCSFNTVFHLQSNF